VPEGMYEYQSQQVVAHRLTGHQARLPFPIQLVQQPAKRAGGATFGPDDQRRWQQVSSGDQTKAGMATRDNDQVASQVNARHHLGGAAGGVEGRSDGVLSGRRAGRGTGHGEVLG
nr:hypothetical protein [Tanacetum cinerariifolium]